MWALNDNLNNYENFEKNHCYDYSLKKSFLLKDKRTNTIEMKINMLDEAFPDLKQYVTRVD